MKLLPVPALDFCLRLDSHATVRHAEHIDPSLITDVVSRQPTFVQTDDAFLDHADCLFFAFLYKCTTKPERSCGVLNVEGLPSFH